MKRKGKITILFVCLGNICRSPAAEAIMKNKLQQHPWLIPDDFVVDSAGIGGWHEGQLPDHRMRSHGRHRGYDISSIAEGYLPVNELFIAATVVTVLALIPMSKAAKLYKARNGR